MHQIWLRVTGVNLDSPQWSNHRKGKNENISYFKRPRFKARGRFRAFCMIQIGWWDGAH